MTPDERLDALEQRVSRLEAELLGSRLEAELLGSRPILLEIRELIGSIVPRLDRIEDRLDRIEEHVRKPGQNGV